MFFCNGGFPKFPFPHTQPVVTMGFVSNRVKDVAHSVAVYGLVGYTLYLTVALTHETYLYLNARPEEKIRAKLKEELGREIAADDILAEEDFESWLFVPKPYRHLMINPALEFPEDQTYDYPDAL